MRSLEFYSLDFHAKLLTEIEAEPLRLRSLGFYSLIFCENLLAESEAEPLQLCSVFLTKNGNLSLQTSVALHLHTANSPRDQTVSEPRFRANT